MRLVVSPRAEADLRDIGDWIEARDPGAALRWLAEIKGRMDLLKTSPGMGAPRFETRRGLRMVLHGDYLVLYTPKRDHILVVRVVHGARRWQSLV